MHTGKEYGMKKQQGFEVFLRALLGVKTNRADRTSFLQGQSMFGIFQVLISLADPLPQQFQLFKPLVRRAPSLHAPPGK